jgi:uncharacterized protein
MDRDAFRARYGSWAFIAGASEGLGAAWARCLASRGLNLYLVARREDTLKRTAEELRSAFPVQVETQALDLASADLLAKLAPLEGRDFGFFIYNAAYSVVQPFLKHSVEQLGTYLDVNCRGPLLLAHHFADRFRAKGRGGIVLMSSIAGFTGTSMLGAYPASKSFLMVLGESLYHELGPLGIDVLVCVAGPTRTPGYLGTDPHYGWLRPPEQEPEPVVEEALAQLGKKALHVTGTANRLATVLMQRLLGRSLSSWFMNKNIRKTYSHRT